MTNVQETHGRVKNTANAMIQVAQSAIEFYRARIRDLESLIKAANRAGDENVSDMLVSPETYQNLSPAPPRSPVYTGSNSLPKVTGGFARALDRELNGEKDDVDEEKKTA